MNRLIRECNHQLDKMPSMISNMTELQRRKDLKQEIEQHKLGILLFLFLLSFVILIMY